VNELESRRSFTTHKLNDLRSRLVEAEARARDKCLSGDNLIDMNRL
jgi:hypothetical protein